MITTFNGSRPADTTQRTSTWNGDGSTLGSPSEDPEYTSGDSEQAPELPLGNGYKPNQNRFSDGSKGMSQITSVPARREAHMSHYSDTPSSFS